MRQYVEHSHKVKMMMQPGQCPGCDEQWGDLSKAIASHCPFCEKLIYFTVAVAMAWQCPLCYEHWSGPDAYYRQHPEERPGSEAKRAEDSKAGAQGRHPAGEDTVPTRLAKKPGPDLVPEVEG